MVDITKDEFWENKYEEVSKPEKQKGKAKELMKNHKAIVLLLASFILLAVSNGLLIYNFFRVLSKL